MLTNSSNYKSFCNDLSESNEKILPKQNSKLNLVQLSSNEECERPKLNGKRSRSHVGDSPKLQKTAKRVPNNKSVLNHKKNQKVISTHYKTPLNKRVPQVFGTITPKVRIKSPGYRKNMVELNYLYICYPNIQLFNI